MAGRRRIDLDARTQEVPDELADSRLHGSGARSRCSRFGALSVVEGELGRRITLRNNEELLDSHGKPTGGTIDGARTVALTHEQADLAMQSEGLWIQGGTPDRPIVNPNQFGFGALRCALDHKKGNNVEWIAFPQGYTHVFCFYYLVRDPPEPGTITVEKQVAGDGSAATTFPFQGNLSTPGMFQLEAAPGAPASMRFVVGATGGERVPAVAGQGDRAARLEAR